MSNSNDKKGLSINATSFISVTVLIFILLGAEGNGSLIAVIIFLLVLGGVFNSLDRCGLMKYMLHKITTRFAKHKYRLMACVVLFFMLLGSCIGSYEECVPLVPLVVALAVGLGWDVLTGIGMSLLAAGCGFAGGIFIPLCKKNRTG